MAQSNTLSVGMDVHKDSIAVAYIAQEYGAEGPRSWERPLHSHEAPSKMSDSPLLEVEM